MSNINQLHINEQLDGVNYAKEILKQDLIQIEITAREIAWNLGYPGVSENAKIDVRNSADERMYQELHTELPMSLEDLDPVDNQEEIAFACMMVAAFGDEIEGDSAQEKFINLLTTPQGHEAFKKMSEGFVASIVNQMEFVVYSQDVEAKTAQASAA